MTSRDIRDIAAYYGAKFSYEIEITVFSHQYGELKAEGLIPMDYDQPYWLPIPARRIDGHLLNVFMFGQVRNCKLHLRPLSSLTDEERTHCAELAGHTPESNYFVIDTQSDLLFYDKLGDVISPCYNPGAIVAYLQSVGIYVPATIQEQYVQLI